MTDAEWEAAAAQAQKQGISIGQFVRDAVERHVLLCKLRSGKQPRRR